MIILLGYNNLNDNKSDLNMSAFLGFDSRY